MSDEIVILGCGIIGLYTALQLADKDLACKVTVVAEYMPGDYSINYTSPWAGANFSSVAGDDDQCLRHDKVTYLALNKLYKRFGLEAGLDKLPSRQLCAKGRELSQRKMDSLKSYVEDFRILTADELPPNIDSGFAFTTFNINTVRFLRFLKDFVASHGTSFVRKRVANIKEAFISENTKLVFNCSGIGSRHLGGVVDDSVYPIKGHVVVVKAPNVYENHSLVTEDFVSYCIPRPNSGGHVVLGGYRLDNDWTDGIFGYRTAAILERNSSVFPELKGAEIIREAVGLRPARVAGVRIEREELDDGRAIIHNYGASGYGYQSGYAMAAEAIALMKVKSKL